jgi:hypothetical protein
MMTAVLLWESTAGHYNFKGKVKGQKKSKNSLKVSIREETGANDRITEIMTRNLTLTDFDFL